MCPQFSAHDLRDEDLRDIEFLGDSLLATEPICVELSDFPYVSFIQHRSTVMRSGLGSAVGNDQSSLGESVERVLLWRSQEQTIWFHTFWYIAVVAYEQAIRNYTIMQLVAHYMYGVRYAYVGIEASDGEPSVVLRRCTSENPVVTLDHFRPQASNLVGRVGE